LGGSRGKWNSITSPVMRRTRRNNLGGPSVTAAGSSKRRYPRGKGIEQTKGETTIGSRGRKLRRAGPRGIFVRKRGGEPSRVSEEKRKVGDEGEGGSSKSGNFLGGMRRSWFVSERGSQLVNQKPQES